MTQIGLKIMSNMKTSNEGLVEIIGHEGIGLSKYKDSVGVWTIGAGSTKTEIPDLDSWPLSKTITIQEAFDLFKSSMSKYEDAINAVLTRNILQTQFDALVSWCYNVGVGWARKATVISLINTNASSTQLYSALLQYSKPKEIIGRRTKEAILLAYGRYNEAGKATLFPISVNGYPMYSKGKIINVWQYINHTSDEPAVPVVNGDQSGHEIKPNMLNQAISLFNDYLNGVQK